MLRTTVTRRVVTTRNFSTARVVLAPNSQPSQVIGHVKWVKGMGEEMLGTVFSSKLKETGLADKKAGIEEMRAAKAIGDKIVEEKVAHEGPVRLAAEGRTEGMLGKVFCCEGMKERGEFKIETAKEKIDQV
ncbi:hypothetical protein BZA77DRAFT_374480 [Pyronema omphalodes]|nr:hypothetical protein BZA77DRAFT_374480 [Pyronema omphalodes]